MSEYPKLLKEVWKTSDGTLFETVEEANRYEMKRRARIAVARAVRSSKYNAFGEYRDPLNEAYLEHLVDCLLEEGVGLKDEANPGPAA